MWIKLSLSVEGIIFKFRQSPVQFQVIIKLTLDTDLSLENHLHILVCAKLNPLKDYDKDHKFMIKLPALEAFLSMG